MTTNTNILMKALGWKGGTIHQVAERFHTSPMNILEPVEIDKIQELKGFAFWNESRKTKDNLIEWSKNPAELIAGIINAYHERKKAGI